MDYSKWGKGMKSAGDPASYAHLTGAERLALGGKLTSIDGDPVVLPPDATLSAAAKDGLVTAEMLDTALPARPGVAWTAFSDAMPEDRSRAVLVKRDVAPSAIWLVEPDTLLPDAEAGEARALTRPALYSLRRLTHWRYALPEEGA